MSEHKRRLPDSTLITSFHESTDPGITYYLENNILGTSLLYLHDLDTDPAPTQRP
jgi:hypothetical protein